MTEKKKMRRERITGLWRKENQYGVYYTGKTADGTNVILHEPHPDAVKRAKDEGKEPPAFVLSQLVDA